MRARSQTRAVSLRALTALTALLGAVSSASCGRTVGPCEHHENTRACGARTIVRPALLRDLGPPGARAVVATVDGGGRAVIAWLVVEEGLSKVLVGEESADGNSFVVREPASRLRGGSLQASVTAGPGRSATVAWKQETGLDTAAVHVSERSTEGAWRDPERPEDAFSFPPRAFEPALATTPLGETVLVWNQWIQPVYGVQIATRARDGNWSRPSNASEIVSPMAFYANSPTPVTSPRGDVLVTWYQAVKTANLSALYSERRGAAGTFSRASGDVLLSPPGGDVGGSGGGSPKPALGPRGEAACAWLQKDDDGRLVPLLASREPDGEWNTPASTREALGVPTGNAITVRAAFGARGTLFVAWTQDLGAGPVLYALRRASDGAWRDDPKAPLELSSKGTSVQSPVLTTGADGTIVLAWIELDRAGSALRLRRSWDDGGDWGPIETLASPELLADSPAVAIGGAPERTVIAWAEGRAPRVQVAVIE